MSENLEILKCMSSKLDVYLETNERKHEEVETETLAV